MEPKEFRIDKSKILTKEYLLDQTNPGKAIQYIRNSYGTLMVDSNSSNIDTERLVINLVNTRYKLLSFNNVLKTQFEEFLDPEITVPDEQQTNTVDQTGTIIDLQNQIVVKDQIIDNLNQTLDNLSTTLSTVSSGSAAASIDVAGIINDAIANAASADNKKPRIFADNTLLRDRDALGFYYIMENGKKRFFNFNEELLNITARAIGKVKPSGTGQLIPDLLDVSQDVLDDIPSGMPFTNFDLVKNTLTPPPPPINLNGKRLIAKWLNVPNPLIITTTNAIPTEEELTVQLQLQIASAEGIVNRVEVWEGEGDTYYQNKPTLPIKDPYGPLANVWARFKIAGSQQTVDNFKVMFKHTNDPAQDAFTTTDFNKTGTNLLNAYRKIELSLDKPEHVFKLAAKIANDVNDEYYQAPEDQLTVIVRYIKKMPNVVNSKDTDAINTLTALGIPRTNISVLNLILTNDGNLFNKVRSSTPAFGDDIDKNSTVTLLTYKAGTLTVPQTITFRDGFTDIVRILKQTGFENIQVSQIYRTGYTTQNLSVSQILKAGNITLNPGTQYKYDDPIYLKVNIWNDGRLIAFTSNSTQPDAILIQYLNNLIPTIV